MHTSGSAQRLMVFVGESDRYRHRPLYAEIVHRAHRAGMAGATVLRGIEGFGSSGLIHTTRLVDLAEDLPIVVILVDVQQRIEAFVAELDDLLTGGLVVIDDVTVERYGPELPTLR